MLTKHNNNFASLEISSLTHVQRCRSSECIKNMRIEFYLHDHHNYNRGSKLLLQRTEALFYLGDWDEVIMVTKPNNNFAPLTILEIKFAEAEHAYSANFSS